VKLKHQRVGQLAYVVESILGQLPLSLGAQREDGCADHTGNEGEQQQGGDGCRRPVANDELPGSVRPVIWACANRKANK
jgi:hypothetical protein